MLANKGRIINTVMDKMCDKGKLHRVEIEQSDKSLQVLDAKPMVPERPHLKTHLKYDVKLPTYEESQTKYAKYYRAEVIENT